VVHITLRPSHTRERILVAIKQDTGRALQPVRTVYRENKISFLYRGLNQGFSSPQPGHHTEHIIPASALQILIGVNIVLALRGIFYNIKTTRNLQ
jgi:hypothetical protein